MDFIADLADWTVSTLPIYFGVKSGCSTECFSLFVEAFG